MKNNIPCIKLLKNKIAGLLPIAFIFILLSTLLRTSLLLILPFSLVNCTGKEVFEPDPRVPDRPKLIPHLGDTGDDVLVGGERLNDSNNGIDTVPDNDWIKIQWARIDHPILDYLKIYRFGEYHPEPTLVDSLPRPRILLNEYTDQTLHIIGDDLISPVGQKWSYFIEVFLTNGNSAVSDTVSYKLLHKPFLIAPYNFAQIEPDSLKFQWERTEDALHYRILVFDPYDEYFWHVDYYIIEDSDYTLPYSGPDLTQFIGERIKWRVDSFGDIEDENGISISGAESNERYVELISP